MRPPDLLTNVIVEPEGYWPVVAEVQASARKCCARRRLSAHRQVHLLEILKMKEAGIHQMYELVRAPGIEELVGEPKKSPASPAPSESPHAIRTLATLHNPLHAPLPASATSASVTPAADIEMANIYPGSADGQVEI